MRLVLSLFALILVPSCTPQWAEPPKVKSPDGSAWWYDISCDAGGLPVCMYVAAHFCNGSYDIVDGPQGRRRPSPGIGSGFNTSRPALGSGFSTPFTATENELLVQCKEADAGAS